MKTEPGSLWRNGDFVHLWIGETISAVGSQVSLLALPLVAALTFNATPMQMGYLGMVQFLPWLLIGLVAGAWVDRRLRRPVLIFADVMRALVLVHVPIAAFFGALRLEHLYVVGFLVGIFGVFFEVAYTAYVPSLIHRDQVVEGNSRLQTSASIAEIAGPGVGGLLIQLLSAPTALIADALSFLVSALFLSRIRTPELRPIHVEEKSHLLQDVRDGIRVLFHDRTLRAFVLTSGTINVFGNVCFAVYVLYATRELGLSPAVLGSMHGIASFGTLAGAILAERLTDRIGIRCVLRAALWGAGIALLLIPVAGLAGPFAVPLLVAAQALRGASVVVYVINALSLRQLLVPNHLQGRVAASVRCLTWGVSPVGFLIGGALGERIGLSATLAVAGLGVLTGLVWLARAPLEEARARALGLERVTCSECQAG